jgi:hypothetical protein
MATKKRHPSTKQWYFISALAAVLLATSLIALQQRSKPNPHIQTTEQQNQSVGTDLPSLDSGAVIFSTPKGWLVQDYEGCHESLSSNSAGCLDARALVPPEKPETVFFNDLENDTYAVFIKVFPVKNRSAEAWFTDVYNNSETDTQRHTSETITLNGQKVFVYKSSMLRPAYGRNGYDDINYVFGKNGKIVIVTAVLAEYGDTQGELMPGNHADFRRYEPDIKSIADSISFR